MTHETQKAIVKIEDKKKKIESNEDFIKKIILDLYSNYRKGLFSKVEGFNPDGCTWEDMIRHIDNTHTKGFDYWVCTAKFWGASEEEAEFIGRFINDDIHNRHQNEEQKSKNSLSLMDIETILSFACVMSYSYNKNQRFYDGAKAGLEDLLLSISTK